LAAVRLSCAVNLSASVSANGATAGESWVTNGASPWEKFLTPDVVTAILGKPPGFQGRHPTNCQNDS
jgi:hypothetical protein